MIAFERRHAAPAKSRPIADRMAETMIETAALDGCCTETDLRAAGYGAAAIAKHAAEAARVAGERTRS